MVVSIRGGSGLRQSIIELAGRAPTQRPHKRRRSMFMPFWDPTMILLIPAMILAFYAQRKVQSTYAEYSRVLAGSRRTGREIAETILRQNGIMDVEVEAGQGFLSDHYDPIGKKIQLSP